jgi:hypothetical protein
MDDEFKNRLGRKETVPVHRLEGFRGDGAVVLRDRRGTAEADFPDIDEKGLTGSDPLAIYKLTGAKQVDPDRALAAFNGWTFAAVNAIGSEVSNIQIRPAMLIEARRAAGEPVGAARPSLL